MNDIDNLDELDELDKLGELGELDKLNELNNLNPLILFINCNFSDCTAKRASVTSGLERRRKIVVAKKNAAVAELAVNQN